MSGNPEIAELDEDKKPYRLITINGQKNNEANYRIILENDDYWKNKIKYNCMKNCIEISGNELNDTILYDVVEWITGNCGIPATANRTISALNAVAQNNRYSPVRNYLGRIYQKWLDGDMEITQIEQLCALLSSDEKKWPLYNKYLRKFLMGAVMRAFEPGCKFDTMLILNGLGGVGKSSFFRILAREWFNDNTIILQDKDSRVGLHSCWIHEDAELESIGKYAMEHLKAFITVQEDRIRLPYARTHITLKRSFVLAGTTNTRDFLTDPTGSRRFWIIEMDKNLYFNLFESMVDTLWAEATHLYFDYKNMCDKKQDTCLETPFIDSGTLFEATAENNKWFYESDEWEETVQDNFGHKNDFTTKEVLFFLDYKEKEITRREQTRVSNILRKMGFVNKPVWCPNNTSRRLWTKTHLKKD